MSESSAPDASRPAWPGWVFAGTILLSAFLLFQVQPLISKFILPWFGGAPAVWTTCMLFFQVALFGGYAYAHIVGSKLSLRAQAIVQGAVLAAAIFFLPIIPSASWKPTGSELPTGTILLLLAATVGLPYFVLSTTSPLVQVWFSRSYPGRSPYRLYALSNVGSLAALLSYPFVFEPAFNLPVQSWLWSGAFAGYIALGALCLAWLLRLGRRVSVPLAPGDEVSDPPGRESPDIGMFSPSEGKRDAYPTVWRRLLWVLLPACASLMLLATTNHVCQDVAVVPFLWVVPLALYLLSFIICFDHQRWYVRGLWAVLAAVAILAVAGQSDLLDRLGRFADRDISLDYIQELVLYFSTMFFICMVCHGELVRLRPDPRHLTEYYLLISAGGAAGGVLVSLVAPQIFKTFLEWKIGLVVSYVVAVIAIGLAAYGTRKQPRGALAGGIALASFLGLAALVYWQSSGSNTPIERARNFYGVVSVWELDRDDPAEHQFRLKHGAITHGEQFTADDKRRIPLTYYGYTSGAGRALKHLQSERPAMRVGVVGLGVGTLATYARKGDTYRFYEINPAVERMAEKYFTYLKDARQRGATVEMAMGDARLSLEREATDSPQRFDVLALDAFSGDSIPAHLLTREAFEIYRKHLAPGGVIAVHVTNSYLYLVPVVRGIGRDMGLGMSRVYTVKNRAEYVLRNDWMLLTDNAKLLSAVPSIPPPEVQDDFDVPLWTDHYNNLFQILKR